MAKHYHVLFGLRGCYMPDDNTVCSSQKDAMAVAAELARNLRDEGSTVVGSAREGYYVVDIHNRIAISACSQEECNNG